MLGIDQLRAAASRSEAVDEIIDVFASLGFQTTGWQSGRVQRTMLLGLSTGLADATELARSAIGFGFNLFAAGPILHSFSKNRFDNDVTPGVKTKGPMRLTSTATIPHTIQVGQLIATTSAGVKFQNLTGGTLSAGSTLDLTFEALIEGASGNVGEGAVNRLLTPLAGVTISNSEGSPWYTTTGADEESDRNLRTRNSTKWTTLAIELVKDGYSQVALANGATKVRVDDNNPRGAGTVNVYVSGPASLLDTPTKEALQLAFSKRVLQTDASWPAASTSAVSVLDAATQELQLTGTVYHDPNVTSTEMQSRIELAYDDFLVATPLGGYDLSPGPANVISLGDIFELFEKVAGVRTLKLTSPSADVAVGTTSLVTRPASLGLVYQPLAS